jgi:muramoyltetrapeptide carboxypeptidase
MKSAALLKVGDTVAIAATARKVSEEEMRPAIELLQSWGLQVHIPTELYEAENQFAGNDKIRAKVFQDLLNNPTIKAIFCARGGYGTVRMVDQLELDPNKEFPLIVGYSDVTVLLAHVWKTLKKTSLHAPMPLNMQPEKANQESLAYLRKTLFEGPQSIEFPIHALNSLKQDMDACTLIGGNLSVLYSILGSNSFPDLNNCILFLEDLDEYVYHIDRMMQGLKRAGVLNGLNAIVVGDMSDMKDNTIPFGKSAYEIIAAVANELNIPIVFGLPSGHESLNLALLMGHTYSVRLIENFIQLEPIKSLN